MAFRIHLFLTVLVVGSPSCATGPPAGPPSGPRTSDGALLTLEEETGPVWEGWQPRPEKPVTPAGLDARMRAFDYWRVGQPELVEEVWTAIFPVVDTVRGEIGEEAGRKTFELMLEAFEPERDGSETQMDLTYLVGTDGGEPVEGLALRFYRRLEVETTPVLTILMLRDVGGSASPTRIAIWSAPGFQRSSARTAHFHRSGDRWETSILDGLVFPVPSGECGEASQRGRLAANMLVEEIWKRFVGRAYASLSRSDGGEETGVPGRIDEALGLEVRRREIDQVYSDSVFPPRANFDQLQ